ncbi:16S rRNA (cytidine1402-2'-O)-methyltransferase [Salsuginibacillus halophilus]|uniref:Ribosomal RNA small subunit methyltransferase I n=1 Tax=Salsuginibacillus halophilus TaxID=517424 RepID=A0A2P8H7N7_9BACI|nr:16S rRNA (cytidine(1402)-2'-O)-methyltransferase [Salsuginibacillus halophilus]PSL42238.1 16S rRNA (cytidine1402-2'-O)-methyltransferase [Salsuginibacillus halophilus]
MERVASFTNDRSGAMYLVPTPIGNLEDMTYRAVQVLQKADIIFCEDTRQTKKLTQAYQIDTPLESLHEHNEMEKTERVIERLKAHETAALVSDAGTPLVSDPGALLVRRLHEEGFPVIPLPGANAAVTAFAASGFGGGSFYFHGFLPRKKKELTAVLQTLEKLEAPLVFYEAPHRLKQTLAGMKDVWPKRRIVVARELTKRYEEFWRGTVAEAAETAAGEVKGEICFIVEGADPEEVAEAERAEAWWNGLTYEAHVQALVDAGETPKMAVKSAAAARGVPKRDVYNAYHQS